MKLFLPLPYWPGVFKVFLTNDQSRSQILMQNNLNYFNIYFIMIVKQRQTGSDTQRGLEKFFIN